MKIFELFEDTRDTQILKILLQTPSKPREEEKSRIIEENSQKEITENVDKIQVLDSLILETVLNSEKNNSDFRKQNSNPEEDNQHNKFVISTTGREIGNGILNSVLGSVRI